jgi:hypothetical protein
MRKKPYYSLRTGKNPHAHHYDLAMLRHFFIDLLPIDLPQHATEKRCNRTRLND